MRYLFPLLFILSCLLTLLPGCEPKEELVQTSGSLELEADTVLFDTVFTTIRTVTKRLWVYNRNRGAVKTDVSLAGKAGATYSLIINGDAGPSAQGVTIRGNDSLLVLVRAVLGDNGQATVAKQFLITDELHFRTNGADQLAHLVAYGQNAYFHRADIIDHNTTWATDKPHVIINGDYLTLGDDGKTYLAPVGVAVLRGVTLRIPKGARIYSHAGAYLQINGTLLVNEDFTPTDTVKAGNANIVRFQGDRLEPFYADVPGQWGGIIFMPTSTGNRIRYAEIKNATTGVNIRNPRNQSPQPDLTLENTVIRNISGSNPSYVNNTDLPGGIVSISSKVTATNCLITNCGEFAVLGVGGGAYNFNFCTIANYTPAFQRETSAFTFTNEQLADTSKHLPLRLALRNSIIWGSNRHRDTGLTDELFLKYHKQYESLVITNSLLGTSEYAKDASVIGVPGVNIINQDPGFKRTLLTSNKPDYTLQDTSPAAEPRRPAAGDPAPNPPTDLLNLPRNQATPSLGAYEYKK